MLIKNVSRDSCQNDHEDGVHFEFEGGDEGYGKDDVAFVVDEVLFVHEQQGGAADEPEDSGFQPFYGPVDVFVVPEHEKKFGDGNHDKQGGQADGDGADRRAPDASRCRVADVGGGVEGDGSRGALGNGDDVRKVGNTDPLVGFHHVVLYQG